MTPKLYVGRQAGLAGSTHPCPVCGGTTNRTHRRGWDRVASLFVPMRRYRCANFSCGWEGNWRMGQEGSARRRKRRLPLVFLASMAFVGASALLGLGFGLMELLPGLQRTVSNLFGA